MATLDLAGHVFEEGEDTRVVILRKKVPPCYRLILFS